MILTHDLTNAALLTVEEFHSALAQFKPQLLIISGFHMLEASDDDTREKRTEEIISQISLFERRVPVHLELASMGDSSFIEMIAHKAVPFFDSLGLNEDELGHLYVALGGERLSLQNFHSPNVSTVEEAIHFIFEHLPIHNKKRALSRIHFHCLEFHLIALSKRVESSFGWKEEKEKLAVVGGSRAVSLRACDVRELEEGEVEMRMPNTIFLSGGEKLNFDPSKSFLQWNSLDSSSSLSSPLSFFLSPVLVCKSPKKTVGKPSFSLSSSTYF